MAETQSKAATSDIAPPKAPTVGKADVDAASLAVTVNASHVVRRRAELRALPPSSIPSLQRSLGNRAVTVMLQQQRRHGITPRNSCPASRSEPSRPGPVRPDAGNAFTVDRFAAPPVPEADPFASPPSRPRADTAEPPPADETSSEITSAPAEVEGARPSSTGGVVDTVKQLAMRALMSMFSAATGGTSSMAGSVVSTLAGVDGKKGEASGQQQERTSEAEGASDTAASSASSASSTGRGLLASGLSAIFGTATALVDGLKGSARTKAEGLANSEDKPDFDGQMAAMKPPGLDRLSAQAESLGDGTTGAIQSGVDTATGALKAAGTAITGGLQSFIGKISSFGQTAKSDVTAKTTANTSSVQSSVGGLSAVVLPLARPILEAVRRVGARIKAVAGGVIAAGITWVVGELKRLLGSIASAIASFVSWLVNGIRQLIAALVRAVVAAVRFLVALPGRVWRWLTLIGQWAYRKWVWWKRQKALDFMTKSFGPKPFVPSTNTGGFDAGYKGGALTIGLSGGINFKPSIVMQGNLAVAARPEKGITDAAASINKLAKPADRPAMVAAWEWDDAKKKTFISKFTTQVQDVWAGKHEFHVEKDYWTDVGATVGVAVDIHEGAKGKNEHMTMTVFQVPAGGGGGGAKVRSNDRASATDNELVVESDDADTGTTSPFLSKEVEFGVGSATPTDPGFVAKIGKTFIPARSCSVCGRTVTARDVNQFISVSVQGDGTDPAAMAQARFNSIKAHLVDAVSTSGGASIFFVHDATVGQTATVTVGNGVRQNTAAHEAGHMFGLSDEYTDAPGTLVPGGSGKKEGTKAAHDELASEMGVEEGAIYENSDNIMSLGNVVRAQHYATFWEALKTITDNDDWRIGGAAPVVMPPKPGSFPSFPSK